MLSRALRIQHTSICRLQLHQRFNHTLKSTSTSTSEEGETRVPVREKLRGQSAFIRTWESFRNVGDAWALLRAVERKYGKVAEAHFLKDYEVKNRYQVYAYVVFSDQESLQRVPREGQSFYIPAPVIEDKPGGLGLDDIRHLLDITDRDESFEFPSPSSPGIKERVIGARIERAAKDFYTPPAKTGWLSRPDRPLSRQFLRWGGFHKLEPMERSRDIKESELFESDMEQVRMRVALQWCSQLTGFRNPAVIHEPTVREEVSDSSPASASMDLPESPVPLDIPISHESTSNLDQSRSPSLPTESVQPLSQSPPEPTQPPPEQTQPPPEQTQLPPEQTQPLPEPTFLPPAQLTPEQVLAKKAMQKQMSRARQLMVNIKRPVAKKGHKPKEETPVDHELDEFPEEPSPPKSKGVMAGIWNLFGR